MAHCRTLDEMLEEMLVYGSSDYGMERVLEVMLDEMMLDVPWWAWLFPSIGVPAVCVAPVPWEVRWTFGPYLLLQLVAPRQLPAGMQWC